MWKYYDCKNVTICVYRITNAVLYSIANAVAQQLSIVNTCSSAVENEVEANRVIKRKSLWANDFNFPIKIWPLCTVGNVLNQLLCMPFRFFYHINQAFNTSTNVYQNHSYVIVSLVSWFLWCSYPNKTQTSSVSSAAEYTCTLGHLYVIQASAFRVKNLCCIEYQSLYHVCQ